MAPAFRVAIPRSPDEDEEEDDDDEPLFVPRLPEAENPGRKENFESSPTVVTSMSDSSLLPPLQLSEVLDPVEEFSSDLVLLDDKDVDVDDMLLLSGYGGSRGVSHMLWVNLCRRRSQLRRKTFRHWLHS